MYIQIGLHITVWYILNKVCVYLYGDQNNSYSMEEWVPERVKMRNGSNETSYLEIFYSTDSGSFINLGPSILHDTPNKQYTNTCHEILDRPLFAIWPPYSQPNDVSQPTNQTIDRSSYIKNSTRIVTYMPRCKLALARWHFSYLLSYKFCEYRYSLLWNNKPDSYWKGPSIKQISFWQRTTRSHAALVSTGGGSPNCSPAGLRANNGVQHDWVDDKKFT